ncbi:MAG: 50S ribosomal protein L29 [Candidatus Poribacteria bacterium]|nr:50S ribosomal protein L29 [Candidatus Poribacteria bacterium]MDE0504642.1 50S ribosomal protein L29 [Candidatus Poribacteria bacterium]
MTAKELRLQSDEDLTNELSNLQESLFNQRFRNILGQLEDTSQLKKVRNDIARIKTILRARERGIESAS